MRPILTHLDFQGSARLYNVPNPVNAQEPATKAYTDALVEGLGWKDNVRVATQANINLASPGAALDAISLAPNDRVLVKLQTTPSQNGIYIWNGPTTPMTRAADANTADELESAVVGIDEGTDAGSSFRQSMVNFTLDTGNVVWSPFAANTPQATEASAGKAAIATQAETDAGTDNTKFITPQKLAALANRKLKVASDIGDGTNTQYTVTHNFNTRDVHVSIHRNSGNYDEVIVDIEKISLNAVRITFAVAPANSAFRVVVIG